MKIKFTLLASCFLVYSVSFCQLQSALTLGVLGNCYRQATEHSQIRNFQNTQYDYNYKSLSYTYSILPNVLYGISKHWQVGAYMDIQRGRLNTESTLSNPSSSSNMSVRREKGMILGSQARYVHFFNPKIGVYAWLGTDYRVLERTNESRYDVNSENSRNYTKNRQLGAILRPGVYWLIHKNIMLDMSIFDVQYTRLIDQKVESSTIQNPSIQKSGSLFWFNSGLQSFQIGIHYVLRLKKQAEGE